jgi:hypothetical protein
MFEKPEDLGLFNSDKFLNFRVKGCATLAPRGAQWSTEDNSRAMAIV